MLNDLQNYEDVLTELCCMCEPLSEYIDHTTEVHMTARNKALCEKLTTLQENLKKSITELQDDLFKHQLFDSNVEKLETFVSEAKHRLGLINSGLPKATSEVHVSQILDDSILS